MSKLIEDNQPLISIAGKSLPSKVEVSALAAFLHTFYTGIENIFGRIYAEKYGSKASGEAWHTETRFLPLTSNVKLSNV